MASVYQNARLTIATSRSASSHIPFLSNELEKPEWIYTTPYTTSYMEEFDPDTESKHLARTCAIPFKSALTEKFGTIYLKELKQDAMVRSVIENADAPLQSRAWTLQERILSPRIVFFEGRELLWECCAGTILQSRECILENVSNRWAMYVPSNNDITRIRMSSHGMRKVLLAREISEVNLSDLESATDFGLTSPATTRPHDLWLDVISAYGLRNVTYRKDALIAMAGIADRMQPIVKDTYLAGIWHRDFRRGLLWSFSGGHYPEPGEGLVEVTNESQFSPPSWSWASRIFQLPFAQFIASNVRDMTYVEGAHAAHFVDHRVVVSHRTRIEELSLRGFSCSVVLKGALSAQWLYPQIDCHFDTTEEISTNVDIDDLSQMVDLSEDGAGRSWNLRFECLIVGQWAFDVRVDREGERDLEPRCHGLLLRPLDSRNYERLGHVSIMPQTR